MAPLQSPNAPTRTSTRTPKPSARKLVILLDVEQDSLDIAEDAKEANAKEAKEEEAKEEEAEEEEAKEEESEEAKEETLKFMSIC
ncbi:hypothetical protein VE00_07845 [Pseudogymnoascus sp. WSF 3629]|nr:hypothetical protein VE00_07845 [Pseudogymnoascus sp. WSF 3629]